MNDKTFRLIESHDILVAFALLTRLPVPVDHVRAGQRGAAAAWAYPLVGLTLGAAAGALAALALWLDVPRGMAAGLALAVLAISTGAMHEDALADFADSLGGKDREHRLAIMKDSHVGAFGALALMLGVLIRWSGIAPLSGWSLICDLALVGAVSRAAMVLAMVALPNARTNGLSSATGRPSRNTVYLALAIGLASSVVFIGWAGLWLFGISLAAMQPILWLAHRTLGGQTGDVLGSAQQFAEIAALMAIMPLG